ncbi:MAG TPA: PilZ domain-containing protein [Nitrospira sp.]|nr:PilZ domain-containing protein [Nitrospira sp.]
MNRLLYLNHGSTQTPEKMDSAMSEQRQLYRVTIDRSGHVRRGDDTFLCNVIDVTEKGVRLRIEGTFRQGEELYLEFPLTDSEVLACMIQVTNRRPPHMGAAIVHMAPDQQSRLSSFIEQLNALNMTGF